MQTSSRRRFLAVAAASAVGASFFDIPQFLTAAEKDADPFGGFPVGAQSYSLRNFTVVEALRHLQGLGVHYVEFFKKHLSPDATKDEIGEVKKLLAKADVAMSSHGVNAFGKDEKANRRVFEFAKRAGLKNITANPTPDSLDNVEKLCEEFNIRIAIHNHGPGALYDKIADVVSAVKGRHPHVGACIDTGHFIRSKEDPIKAIHELKGRVFGLHLKDVAAREKQTHNVILGSKFLDLPELFTALKKTEFPADGALSLEYEANPENPVDDMKQCLEKAKEAIAKLR